MLKNNKKESPLFVRVRGKASNGVFSSSLISTGVNILPKNFSSGTIKTSTPNYTHKQKIVNTILNDLEQIVSNIKENDFSIKKGPIFANFVLADEINRAPAKVQSALLEAMQEKQVTIGDTTFPLKQPFLVMATQNPVEQEGTYPLPEAQVDRFMLKTVIDYPTLEDEQLIVRSNLSATQAKVNPVVTTKQIITAQETVRSVYMDEKIEKYILDLVFATRYPERYGLSKIKPLISFGASPRGSINLATAAKCHAFLKHRGYVIPEDVRAIVFDVLRHRIGLTYEAEAENVTTEDIISQIINEVEVP